MNTYRIDIAAGTYRFAATVAVPKMGSPCFQERTALSAVFECMAFIKCVDSPFLGDSEWWIGFVQTILRDTVTLHYADGAQCTLRSYSRRPKDQDLNIERHIDPRISLFDVSPHSCQRIPVHGKKPVDDPSGNLAKKQKEWGVLPSSKDVASVLFYDKPAVGIGRAQQVYLDDVATGRQEIIGFDSPFPTHGALQRITGGLRFALWIVLMRDPATIRLDERARMFFPDNIIVPIGPQSLVQFVPIYHFIWSVDFTADVAGQAMRPTGTGMMVLSHGAGGGHEVPTLTGRPATTSMGTEISMELQPMPEVIELRRL